MDANPDTYTNSSSSSSSSSASTSNSRRYGLQFPALSFLQSPVSTLLEYSGILRPRSDHHEAEGLIASANDRHSSDSGSASGDGEVSIRIIGAGEQEQVGFDESEEAIGQIAGVAGPRLDHEGGNGGEFGDGERVSSASSPSGGIDTGNGEGGDGSGNSNRDSSYQRYDIQQVARLVEQVLPFSLLLLVVFIRQHLQGFFVTIWITAVMFKSNDILRKQTALKGERKISILVGISTVFMLQVIGVYWWYWNDDLLYPLFMVPPKEVPPFWHAIFVILVNDTMVRQAAMALKCVLLMYYKNGRGHNFRRQGQMLTLVEYTLLLYRALLPTPVWYRFFLNKEYGGLFSSLTTGLYLTFKLTSIVEKVQSFFTALKALSRKEIHYGSYATSEQVNAAGDLCAICQEKMHSPILLRCKHIFCEDCVSEWFERERTCPLCRALVRPADLRSFGDGSTTLLFQLF
ncbi:RING finger and transmembrane domain-containing protein 2 [Camellia lanceoleosa]|uniref:RING finger and transmembrane domain-containing protein 2 n=1 Tax=Camellia lanceoleosa TaxID=1840588 RepID=A0ACC0GYB9_9ERIC|nr:RING finger and transmembrane domain-containing protein 2 [Camellia lanceoleosa]